MAATHSPTAGSHRSLATLIDYLIPAAIVDESIDRAYRARVLISASMIAAAFMIPFMIARGTWNGFDEPVCYILGICCLILMSTPVILQVLGSVAISGLYLTSSTALVLMSYTYFDGGFYSTALPWFPILPLFSVFFAGFRWGLLIGTMLLADLALLWFLHDTGRVPEPALTPSQINALYFGSATAVLLLLLVLANLYVYWQNQIRAQLLAANRAKDEFLSRVSHDLRTPLNSILGFSEVLQKGYAGELNEEQREYVNLVNSSGNQLLALVDDLLDLSAIDTRGLKLHWQSVNIPNVIEDLVAQHSPAAADKNLEFIVDIGEILHSQDVELDITRFQQVVSNLLSNAIKFSPRGGLVEIHADSVAGQLQLVIEDQGPGVPEQDRERIFERFPHQGVEIDGTEGTGLGLALTRQLVRLHGGEVTVEDRSGRAGSAFVVSLPIAASGAASWGS